jgi:hypothetical protein
VNPKLLGDLRHALAIGRPHPPADIRLDGLAVTTHRSVPSGPPGGGSGRDGEASTFLAEGAWISNASFCLPLRPHLGRPLGSFPVFFRWFLRFNQVTAAAHGQCAGPLPRTSRSRSADPPPAGLRIRRANIRLINLCGALEQILRVQTTASEAAQDTLKGLRHQIDHLLFTNTR